MADPHSAISVGRVTVETVDHRHVQRAMYLSDLAMALGERYKQAGAKEGLGESVTLLEEAVAVTPDGEFEWAGRRSNLAGALRLRYESEGALADLDRVVTLLDEAVRASPAKPSHKSNLAAALTARARHTHALEDLDRVVQVAQDALFGAPAEYADRAVLESTLARALIRRSQRTGSDTDLDEALESTRRSLQVTPADRSGRVGLLADTSAALGELFVTRGDPLVLNGAISPSGEAIAATPAGHRAGRAAFRAGCVPPVAVHGVVLVDPARRGDRARAPSGRRYSRPPPEPGASPLRSGGHAHRTLHPHRQLEGPERGGRHRANGRRGHPGRPS
ncbi:tetratricopeptide repeat protein [Streptomyces sp. NPDC056488]|uniref:tetratricopeptide repeat protein n=1 Tax=Streptomyces sp. NPDC056488 TaxID=3345836 RepID=UPI0036742D05